MTPKHAHAEPERLSDALLRLAASGSERLTLGEALDGLGERSFGGVMLMIALPAMISPPGVAALFAAPLLIISGQLLLGRPHPWLPRLFLRASLSRAGAERSLLKAAPMIRKAELWFKPRLMRFLNPLHDRLVGLACVGMSLVLMLPAPFAHTAAGLAVVAFSAGSMEEDGMALMLGWALAATSAVLLALLIGGAIEGVRLL